MSLIQEPSTELRLPAAPACRAPSDVLKVAIVGCGKIADAHVEEVGKRPEARVVALCDREPLMAEQLGARYGIEPQYSDLGRLLAAEKPDVVHIATPPQSHSALARQALEAGCHVFVEKPVTLDAGSTRALVEYAQRCGRKLTVGYSTLFEPPAVRLREMVRGGTLGEPVHLESFYGYDLSSPFGAALLADPDHWVRKLPGQLFHNVLDHVVGKVVEYLPDERPAVTARAFTRSQSRTGPPLLDELRVILEGERTSAYLTFTAHARPVGHYLRLFGTANTAHADFAARLVTLEERPRLPGALGRLQPGFGKARQYAREAFQNLRAFARSEFHFFAGMNRLVAGFYASILQDTDPPIPYRDIIRVGEIMDEIWSQVAAQQEALG